MLKPWLRARGGVLRACAVRLPWFFPAVVRPFVRLGTCYCVAISLCEFLGVGPTALTVLSSGGAFGPLWDSCAFIALHTAAIYL